MSFPTSTPARLGGLGGAGPVVLERWFARHGAPPAYDLARSGAPARSLAELVQHAPDGALDELLATPLDYGAGRGSAALRSAIAQSGAARTAGEVVVTHGAVEALLLTCSALVGRRRRVLVGVPAYEALRRTPHAAGAQVVEVPGWRPGRAELDIDALHDIVDDTVAAVLLNSPNNPTGATAGAAGLEALARRCHDAGAVLVVDEVAARTLDAAAQHACALDAFGSGAVVALGDISKSCGLGGLRVGWLTTASPLILDRVAALKDLTTVGNAVLSETVATWALQRRDDLVAATRAVAEANLGLLRSWVDGQAAGASLTAPRDGLVALPRLPALASCDAADRLRREHGVALVPGELVGVAEHVRLGLGVDPQAFATALQRVDAALRSPAG